MKKILMLALLSIAFNALADDYFLYWMVSDDATITSIDGKVATPLNQYGGTLYAKVREVNVASGETSRYLNLYASPDEATYGTVDTFTPGLALAVFAGLDSIEPTEGMSYYVELYNSYDIEQDSYTWIGRAMLSWSADNVTDGSGKKQPLEYAVTSFTAAPEPTSGLLMLVGLAGLALRRKNKRA